MTSQSLQKGNKRSHSDADKPIRVNLGCGGYSLDGFTNVDLFPPADIVGDFMEMDFTDLEEVVMIHSLEHLPWVQTPAILSKIKGWLAPGGTLTIEVPDMETILALGTGNSCWLQWVYGCQAHEGEFHKAGFTKDLLMGLLELQGYRVTEDQRFSSNHPMRVGFPCLRVVACV
jgi:predicted SAM-dependent methyltransferase